MAPSQGRYQRQETRSVTALAGWSLLSPWRWLNARAIPNPDASLHRAPGLPVRLSPAFDNPAYGVSIPLPAGGRIP